MLLKKYNSKREKKFYDPIKRTVIPLITEKYPKKFRGMEPNIRIYVSDVILRTTVISLKSERWKLMSKINSYFLTHLFYVF